MQRRFVKADDSAITTSSGSHITAPLGERPLKDISRLLHKKDVHYMLQFAVAWLSYL